ALARDEGDVDALLGAQEYGVGPVGRNVAARRRQDPESMPVEVDRMRVRRRVLEREAVARPRLQRRQRLGRRRMSVARPGAAVDRPEGTAAEADGALERLLERSLAGRHGSRGRG